MKREKYMSKNEFIQFMKLNVLVSEIEQWINTTDDPKWRRKMKNCRTQLFKLMVERLVYLDEKQRNALENKHKTMKMQFVSTSNFYGTKAGKEQKRTVEIDAEDLYNLADFALTECMTCPQGDTVKNCEMRELYHRCGLEPTRCNCGEGECEFRSDNEVKAVSIEHRRICVPII